MTDQPNEEKKIIVDEDWKAQVQAEKEAARHEKEADADAPKAESPGDTDTGEIPPASFSTLVVTLATQAMASLGQVPDPAEGKPVVRLELAGHFIDTLAILQEKTKGNLTDEESAVLENVLHELRMAHLAVRNQAAE